MRALFVFVMSLMWNVGFCEEPQGSEGGPLPPPFNPTGLVTSHKHGCTGHTESRKGESSVKCRIQRRSNTCFHHTANDSFTKKCKQIDTYGIMSRRRIDNKPSRGFMLDHIYSGITSKPIAIVTALTIITLECLLSEMVEDRLVHSQKSTSAFTK